MAGQTLDIYDFIEPDKLGSQITDYYIRWENLRQIRKDQWRELAQYIFQTDTSQTSNSSLPWKNKTTTPKLTQIRDNLYSNYLASLFPKRRWLQWEGNSQEDQARDKKEAIESFMAWAIDRPEFKQEISKLVLDYIDHGNVIATVDWLDQRKETAKGEQVGYVGPVPLRIAPQDIVFNPIAPSFIRSPKIIRSYLAMGELKKLLVSMTKEDEHDELKELFSYLTDLRDSVSTYSGELIDPQDRFGIAGFGSFKDYLLGDYIEVLTFYGDLYNTDTHELLENHKIMVVDRHKVVYKKPNPSFFGFPPIFHSGWRIRQDNLWAMGPLDNLVGMQYRIDHLENMKADVWDVVAFPVFKVKGYVEDFQWRPLEKIIVGDDGDVELLTPDTNVLNANTEIDILERRMEEMAGSPKEAMGMRTPGEKTMYEVQRLENAASRIFQNKIVQFEEQVLEPLLNAMLELARRKLTSETTIRVLDDEFHSVAFNTLTASDITGSGRIRPVAARHFAERAELIQNVNNFVASPLYQDPAVQVHWSGIKLSKMVEETLNLEDWKLVQENIRISEQADTQKLGNVQQEQMMMEAETPSGLTPEDFDD